jgi:hypothetical protein
MLVFACNDSTLVQPEPDTDLQISAKMGRNPHNPFVGSWWAIDPQDGSLQHVTISHANASGDAQVKFEDTALVACDGGPGKSRATGRISSKNENLLVFYFYQGKCQGGETIEPYPDPLGFLYVPADDELKYCLVEDEETIFCAWRFSRIKPRD